MTDNLFSFSLLAVTYFKKNTNNILIKLRLVHSEKKDKTSKNIAILINHVKS